MNERLPDEADAQVLLRAATLALRAFRKVYAPSTTGIIGQIEATWPGAFQNETIRPDSSSE